MSNPLPADKLILIRHTPVAEESLGCCYGRSDVPLRPDAHEEHERIAGQLAHLRPAIVLHSGLARTHALALRLAKEFGCEAMACPEIRERDFGSWELQSWDAIHHTHGDDMMRMLTEPHSYRPGGGETTFELRDRVVAWYQSLPPQSIVAVTHGGPIAALLGTLRRLPVESWVSLIPACGQWVVVPRQVVPQRAVHNQSRELV